MEDRTFRWRVAPALFLLALLALLVAAIAVGRLPKTPSAAEARPWSTYFRGHTTVARYGEENLHPRVQAGSYPPRALGLSGQRVPPSSSWLLDADSDADRFRRLEAVLRPEQAMREIGIRFVELHDALFAGKVTLARYEWDRATHAAEVALLMRPANQERVEQMFLLGPWRELGAALESNDLPRAREAFVAAREACRFCHEVRGRAFLNTHPVFTATAAVKGEDQ